jgi:WD domain, G-beta repeat
VLTFAPNGKRLYSSGGMFPNIHVWDVARGKMIDEIEGLSGQFAGSRHKHPQEFIAVAPDSQRFATAASMPAQDGSHWLRVWDAGTGALIYKHGSELPLSRHCSFAPTGELLLVLDAAEHHKDDRLTLIEPNTGARRWTNDLKQTRVASVAFSADGQNLAVGGDDGTLVVYEGATGRRRHAFGGHRRTVDGVAFTPDGALLAAASTDGPVLLWDVYGTHDREAALPKWTAAEAPQIWKDLTDANAERAFKIVRRLVHNPEAAGLLLRERLLPAAGALEKQFQKLLRELDSDQFEVRQQAYTELNQRAAEFEFLLHLTALQKQSLEVRRRLEPIIAKLDPANPERLRRLRALEALRQIATPEARQLLEALAAPIVGERRE